MIKATNVFGGSSKNSKWPKVCLNSRSFPTILMISSVKVVLISIFQGVKTLCSKIFWFFRSVRLNLERSVSVMILGANMSLPYFLIFRALLIYLTSAKIRGNRFSQDRCVKLNARGCYSNAQLKIEMVIQERVRENLRD